MSPIFAWGGDNGVEESRLAMIMEVGIRMKLVLVLMMMMVVRMIMMIVLVITMMSVFGFLVSSDCSQKLPLYMFISKS